MIAYKFSELDYDLGFDILKSYLIRENIFGRVQLEAKSEQKKLDLNYVIDKKTEQMHITKNNAGELEKPYKRDKEKYVYASSIPKDTIMNEKFIDQLDSNNTYSQIFISRFEIKNYISYLDLYSEALILKRVFPNLKLKLHNKKLGKYEKDIDKLSYQVHRKHLFKALKSLYDLIILAENDKDLKAKIMNNFKSEKLELSNQT